MISPSAEVTKYSDMTPQQRRIFKMCLTKMRSWTVALTSFLCHFSLFRDRCRKISRRTREYFFQTVGPLNLSGEGLFGRIVRTRLNSDVIFVNNLSVEIRHASPSVSFVQKYQHAVGGRTFVCRCCCLPQLPRLVAHKKPRQTAA